MSSPTTGGYPEYYLPMTGYVFWRLQSGESRLQALERAKIRPGFPRLSDEQWDEIGRLAYLEFTGTQTARIWEEARPDTALGLAFGQGAVPEQGFGARVFATVTLLSGAQREVSVLANCYGNCTVTDVVSYAKKWIVDNAAAVWGSQYDVGSIDEAHIAQLSLIPWDSAAITITG